MTTVPDGSMRVAHEAGIAEKTDYGKNPRARPPPNLTERPIYQGVEKAWGVPHGAQLTHKFPDEAK